MSADLDDIIADFDLIEDWDERYRYLIELGRDLEPLPDEARNDANKVRGCASQVWIETRANDDGSVAFRGDSDAHIVKGLVRLTLAVYSGRTPGEILATDAGTVFERLGLAQHLTPQRSNGVRAMVERIKTDARRLASGG
ncbi:MAG: SufE family protein [Beijerinckiaceae bacterium]|jgi:cysteine desulfuration protein SufE|nr:SufE family protein [Beijerinckiaceae bacterium]